MGWEVFDKLYHRYDEWFDESPGKEIFKLEIECLKEAFRGSWGLRLEIGVGTGRFAEKLRIDFGVDPSEEMLRKASEREIEVVKAVAEHLPFPPDFFGGVAIIVTFCFLDDPLKALRECFRVLTKGGILLLGIVPRGSRWGRFYLKKKEEGHPFYSLAHFYTTQEVMNLSEKAGFELEALFSTLFQGPEECVQIRSYSPKPEQTEKAGFVCIKMRKPYEAASV
ncbi:MAG: class I SAM-dependent methyltransferase [bacterium]